MGVSALGFALVDIAAATQAARLVIDNASGFTAAVIADFGSK